MKTHTDIQTNPAIGERGRIDVYLPDAPGPHAFVLIVHGGGWKKGSYKSWQWIAERMVSHNLAAITCSYRVSTEAKFPAAYDDLVALMKWLRAHGAAYSLDADRMALLGGSAGGHLVCLLGCRAPQDAEHATVRAVVGYCPVADTRSQFESDPGNDLTVALDFLGGSPDEVPDAYAASSPTDHVHPNVPPAMLIHGDADKLVWVEPTIAFARKLRAAGVETILHIAKGFGHGVVRQPDSPDDAPRLLYETEVTAFLDAKLR